MTLTPDKELLLKVASLCCVAHVELSYSERNTAIWEAFRLGQEYADYFFKFPVRPAREGRGGPA